MSERSLWGVVVSERKKLFWRALIAASVPVCLPACLSLCLPACLACWHGQKKLFYSDVKANEPK
jgi:hypothetical protein